MNELQRIAEWDWTTASRATVLHHVSTGDFNEHDWLIYGARFTCGRTVPVAFIPGPFTRMGAKRCDRCCDRLGYPRGVGSPKNDDACRWLLNQRTAAQSGTRGQR